MIEEIKEDIKRHFWEGETTLERKMSYWSGYLRGLHKYGKLSSKDWQELYLYLNQQNIDSKERLGIR